MKENRVVITGIGILASNGLGKDQFWQSLQAGEPGYGPISLFDTKQFSVNIAGEISDFDAKTYMGQKGLRSLDRSTKLLVSSAFMAVDDCGFKITEENTDDVGVSCGTTLGSLKSIARTDPSLDHYLPKFQCRL